MDVVSRGSRGRWNSIESLSRWTWAFSALFGSFIVERKGYRACFVATSLIYIVAISPLFPLVKELRRVLPSEGKGGAEGDSPPGESMEMQPLARRDSRPTPAGAKVSEIGLPSPASAAAQLVDDADDLHSDDAETAHLLPPNR